MFIVLNKRTTVLEFGTGYSTLVMHYALMENQKRYGNKKPFPRCEHPYEIFAIDNNKFFTKISKNRVKKYSKKTTRRRKNAPDEINTHKRFGGLNKMDIFNSGLQHLPAYIFKNLDINNDESTNAIIRKLKINVTPDMVENGIKQIIKSMNSSKKSQHVSEKLSCWQVR
jgi:hypothetical protein